MRKILLFVALCAGVALAVSGTQRHKTFKSTGTTAERQVTDVALNAIQDTINNGTGRIADTLNSVVPRFIILYHRADSTYDSIKVKKLRNDTLINDSLTSNKASIAQLNTYNLKGIALTTLDTVYTLKGVKAALFDGPLKGNVTGNISGAVTGTTISSTRDSTGVMVAKDTSKLNKVTADSIFVRTIRSSTLNTTTAVLGASGYVLSPTYFPLESDKNAKLYNFTNKGVQVTPSGRTLIDSVFSLRDSTGIMVAKDSVKTNRAIATWCSVGTNIVVKDTAKINVLALTDSVRTKGFNITPDTGSAICSLVTVSGTYIDTCNIKYYINGNLCTILFHGTLSGSTNAGTLYLSVTNKKLKPTNFAPLPSLGYTQQCFPTSLDSSATRKVGELCITSYNNTGYDYSLAQLICYEWTTGTYNKGLTSNITPSITYRLK